MVQQNSEIKVKRALRDRFHISRSRREAIRTTLWIVPTGLIVVAAFLFVVTYALDRAADSGNISFPSWVTSGSPDAARQLLIAIAATTITVVGVVFSITILVLQLASQQFGPRMLRNFIRDTGTQISLGSFVATFVYSILALGSITSSPAKDFVPHLSVTTTVALSFVNLAVLIYFIHHVAVSIQLTSVVSGIARDFRTTLANVQADSIHNQSSPNEVQTPAIVDLSNVVLAQGGPVHARSSGYLQAIGHNRLLAIATSADAVIRLVRRPGHFVVEGQTVAYVLPAAATPRVAEALAAAQVVGPNRTLTQDPGFALDQLVEVALRALSSAINDTFTALNCIDWLGDCLCHAINRPPRTGIYHDAQGAIRVIEPNYTFDRMLKGATDKIRQSGQGIPAVLIRQLENLQKVMVCTHNQAQRNEVLRQAGRILRSAEASITDPGDLEDIRAAYIALGENTELHAQVYIDN